MTDLSNLRSDWNALAEADPFWAILSDPAKVDRGWDADAFFETGREWVDAIMPRLREIAPGLGYDRAMDFGCGAGRVTQALCEHFAECDGVDISEAMIALAYAKNRHGARCRYHANATADLGLFADATFDFVHSILVLQHMDPLIAERYIAELARVTKLGGVVMFQAAADIVPENLQRRQSAAPPSRPVEDGDYAIALDDDLVRDPVTAGKQALVLVEVENRGRAAQVARGRLLLVPRWLAGEPRRVVRADARTLLPADLSSGEQVDAPVLVTAPTEPGTYVVAIELAEEAADGGAEPRVLTSAACAVEVRPAGSADAGGGSREPQIQMHGIPRRRVEDVLRASALHVADVVEDRMAGADWSSFTYWAVK